MKDSNGLTYWQRPEVKARKKEYDKEFYQKNRERILTRVKKHDKEFYRKNRERILTRVKKHNKKLENKISRNKREKQRRKTDLNYNIRCLLANNFCSAMTSYSRTGKIKFKKLYGIDIVKCVKKLIEDLNEAGITKLGIGFSDGYEYDIDHIIPASWFNHNNPNEIKWCWSPENLQWLRKDINRWKGNRKILPLLMEEQDVWMKKMFPESIENN